LEKHEFVGMPRELREDILSFYKDGTASLSAKNDEKDKLKLERQLERLREVASSSNPVKQRVSRSLHHR
jgi:hypothetical protein